MVLPEVLIIFHIINAFIFLEKKGCIFMISLSKIAIEIRQNKNVPLLSPMFNCSCCEHSIVVLSVLQDTEMDALTTKRTTC
jgi:hypothetical protein